MDRIFRFVEFVATVVLVLLCVLIFGQVVLRNVLNLGFSWVEELSRYLLLSMVLITTPVVFRSAGHVRVDFLPSKLNGTAKRVHEAIVVGVGLFFFGAYIVSHLRGMVRTGDVRSPSLNLSNEVFFFAGLAGAALGLIAGVLRLLKPKDDQQS